MSEDRIIRLKMTLSERLLFPQIYPEKTNVLSAVLRRDIAEKVQLTQNQMELLGVKIETNRTTWNTKKDKTTTVGFTVAEMKFLKTRVDDMDKKEEIRDNLLDVILKIQDVNLDAKPKPKKKRK